MVMDTVEKHLATYINWVLTKMYFEYIYTEVCSLGLSWREVNMGSDMVRSQTGDKSLSSPMVINYIDANMRHTAPMGLNQLIETFGHTTEIYVDFKHQKRPYYQWERSKTTSMDYDSKSTSHKTVTSNCNHFRGKIIANSCGR